MKRVRPFGDHTDDGIVQVSFTLPVRCSPTGRIAAQRVGEAMGLKQVEVVHELGLSKETTYFILYGKVECSIDIDQFAKCQNEHALLNKAEAESVIERSIGRPVRVIGASTGSDTHSVGIDAILNHKGYNGHLGLEAYAGFKVRNLGSQVPNEKLIAEAISFEADAILVSQTVTQQDLHVANLTALVDMLEAEGLRDQFLLICGGARISQELAKELGYDAGFSKGSFAEHVASYLVSALLHRSEAATSESE